MIVAGLDSPGDGEQFGSTMRLLGWAFADSNPISRVEVRLDGRFVALLLTTVPRADVQMLHAAAPLRTGFAASLDLTDLAAGPHELHVTVFDTTDACLTFVRTFVSAERWNARDSAPGAPTVLAFYLPQYHPIAVNDASWGRGFTEWTNVAPARALFKHHYQPHLPGELGFYDLRVAETRAEQARLAAEHGIGGFVYYHYWFSGTKLLDRPLREVIASNEPRFPFCVCFANENWTRAWDGRDDDVLLGQRHSPDDDAEFIRDLIPVLRDDRYIRIDGRPLVLVYRPSLFPDPRRTAERWRNGVRRSRRGRSVSCLRAKLRDGGPCRIRVRCGGRVSTAERRRDERRALRRRARAWISPVESWTTNRCARRRRAGPIRRTRCSAA